MKLFHVSAKIYRPGEIVGPLTRNHYSDPVRASAESLRAQTTLDARRPAGALSRLSAHFAFDRPELRLAYWSEEAKRARIFDAASPYLVPPRYYEIGMPAPVRAPMAVAEWVFQLIDYHIDPTPAITEY